MSHRAIVAYQQSDETYNLHYSHNGAQDYVLKPILDGYLDGTVPEHAGEMPTFYPAELGDFINQDDVPSEVEHVPDLIETEPLHTEVPSNELAGYVNFFTTEALYVVRDWTVEVYAPVHISPIVIPHLAGAVTLDIYEVTNSGQDDISMPDVKTEEPEWTLSVSDFAPENLDTVDDTVYELLEMYHLDMLDFYNQVYHTESTTTDTKAIYTGDYLLMCTVSDPQYHIHTAGLFINNPWNERTNSPKYPWHRMSEHGLNPRQRANQVRLDVAKRMTREIFKGDVADDETAAETHEQTHDSPVKNGVTRFLVRLIAEYNADISRKFISAGFANRLNDISEKIRDQVESST